MGELRETAIAFRRAVVVCATTTESPSSGTVRRSVPEVTAKSEAGARERAISEAGSLMAPVTVCRATISSEERVSVTCELSSSPDATAAVPRATKVQFASEVMLLDLRIERRRSVVSKSSYFNAVLSPDATVSTERVITMS